MSRTTATLLSMFLSSVAQGAEYMEAVGVIGDNYSSDNPCSAEGKAKKAQNK